MTLDSLDSVDSLGSIGAVDAPARGVRIRVHPGLCEGWGNCHRFGPAVYTLDADGMVDLHVVDVPEDLAEDARFGAAACPQHAITVIELHPDEAG